MAKQAKDQWVLRGSVISVEWADQSLRYGLTYAAWLLQVDVMLLNAIQRDHQELNEDVDTLGAWESGESAHDFASTILYDLGFYRHQDEEDFDDSDRASDDFDGGDDDSELRSDDSVQTMGWGASMDSQANHLGQTFSEWRRAVKNIVSSTTGISFGSEYPYPDDLHSAFEDGFTAREYAHELLQDAGIFHDWD